MNTGQRKKAGETERPWCYVLMPGHTGCPEASKEGVTLFTRENGCCCCCLAELADLVWLPPAWLTCLQEQARTSVFLGKGVPGLRMAHGHQGAVTAHEYVSHNYEQTY